MIKVRFSFLLAVITGGLLSLIASCNQADKDVVPAKVKSNPVIATNDNVQTLPGGRVVIDLLKNDQIAANSSISLLKEYLKKGTAEFIKQGVVMYTPADSSTGTDTLAYTICPPGQPCDTGAVKISISNQLPDSTTQGINPDFATTLPDQPVGIDVLQNDHFSDSTNGVNRTVDIIENPKNGTTSVANGYFVTYTPNQGFKGTDWFVYGVKEGTSNNYVGYGVATITVQDTTNNGGGNGCTITALNDTITVSEDSLTSNGTDVYIDVLSNDSLCNQQLTQEVTNNGGFNDVSFVNGRLKVKVYPGDGSNGARTVSYALKENGVTKASADVSILFNTDSSNCVVSANSDSLNIQQNSLASGGTYKYIDVLNNDELCNQQLTYEITSTGGFNDVSFENGRIKVKLYSSDVGTFTIRYALKQNNAIKSETDVTVVIQ